MMPPLSLEKTLSSLGLPSGSGDSGSSLLTFHTALLLRGPHGTQDTLPAALGKGQACLAMARQEEPEPFSLAHNGS